VTETNVFQLLQPGTFADPLTEVLRNGDERCLPRLVETEVADLLGRHADDLTEDGRPRLARRFCVIISVPFYHISQCRHQTKEPYRNDHYDRQRQGAQGGGYPSQSQKIPILERGCATGVENVGLPRIRL
jgi:hypothetical protein